MVQDQLYNMAYKYLLAGIRLGRYPDGSSLPSTPELCASLDVSHVTIHNALKLLEEEGYVSLRQGRRALVTYATQPEACRARYLAYCQSMKDAMIDLSGVFPQIWPEALAQGLKLCDEQDLRELEGLVEEMSQRVEYPYLEFYTHILRKLGNPLLMNLYLSTLLFGQYTAMHPQEQDQRADFLANLQEMSLQILALRRDGSYTALKEVLRSLYQRRSGAVARFYTTLPPAAGPVKPIPYRWNYYNKRPSVGLEFAMTLLRDVYAYYQPMEYLPSVAALSRRYSIPAITVRRSIRILCEIGVVETVNGKGTRVLVGAGRTIERAQLASPNMKKALLPYLQSVQVILLICGDVARAILPELPEGVVRGAVGQLREILASGDYTLTFGAVYKPLMKHARSPALREILTVLMKIQYLSYPLLDLEPTGFRYDPRSAKALLKSLEERDPELFAVGLQRLMADIFQAGKEKLVSGGIQEAASIALPPLSWGLDKMRGEDAGWRITCATTGGTPGR